MGALKEIRAFLVNNGGIYCWIDSKDNKAYIGSSRCLWKRFSAYKNSFFYKKTSKQNIKLLNRVKKYGFKTIKFYILEIFNEKEVELRNLEQKYLNKYKTYEKNGFNIQKNTINYFYKKISGESLRKIKEANTGENSSNAKLNNEKVIKIKKALSNGEKIKNLSKEYKVSTTVISNIKRGLTWNHIKIDKNSEKKIQKLVIKDKRKNWDENFIKSIKKDINSGMKMSDIAKKYNINYTAVSGLKYGCFYKNITP